LIAVIGPQCDLNGGGRWQTDQSAGDWVAEEISTALRRRIPVIPVPVDAAKMLATTILPPNIPGYQKRLAKDPRRHSGRRLFCDHGELVR
jgi:hypothetical protein